MPHDVLTPAIDALASGHDLSSDQAAEVLAVIMAGEAGEAQTAAFLIALRTKGETVEEIAGLARTMRALSTPVTPHHHDLLDTAGTGGGRTTFNVSTTAALIAAGPRARAPQGRRAPRAVHLARIAGHAAPFARRHQIGVSGGKGWQGSIGNTGSERPQRGAQTCHCGGRGARVWRPDAGRISLGWQPLSANDGISP